jgi:hypothetical protein
MNENRMSVRKLAEVHGYDDVSAFLEEVCSDSVVPACCAEGCEVEPDGRCCHNNPSPLIAMGII